ncbi:MAG TPA: response regulator [Flavihumibacter sp.]|jgi:CheY-like chemotaxis protein
MKGNRVVLLVDDDEDDIELLTEIFSGLEPSLQVIALSSGKKAVEFILKSEAESLPNLILLDFNIPDMNGAEVLNAIRGDKRLQPIPKVVWSTSDASIYEQICKQSGATDYYKKPDTIHAITALARELLAILK